MGLSIKADTALVTPRINRKTKTDMKRFCPITKGDWRKWGKLSLKSISSPDKNQFKKLNWKFDGLFALVYAIHAYNYLLLNEKSFTFKYLLLLFITIFSYFIFKCTQFGRKWLSPLCDELSSLFQQEKGFSSNEAIFLDFPANPNNGKILQTLSSLCIPCLIWQIKMIEIYHFTATTLDQKFALLFFLLSCMNA